LAKRRFHSQTQAHPLVFQFIEGWYHTWRRHSSIDCFSPIEFEKRHAARPTDRSWSAAGSGTILTCETMRSRPQAAYDRCHIRSPLPAW